MDGAPDPSRRSEASRQATLEAALALCVEVGYGRLTIEGIAARAGVSKKTIYRWWPSKGAVVLEAIDDVAIRSGVTHPDTGDLATDMRAQLTTVISLFTEQPTAAAFSGLLAQALLDPELAKDLRLRLIDPRIDSFRTRFLRARQQGQVAADVEADGAMDLFYGVLYHRLVLHLEMPDTQQLDRHVSHVMRAIS